jgi:hypothetical protein
MRDMVANRAPQHWILRFERVEDRALRDGCLGGGSGGRTIEVKLYLALDMRQGSQMEWEHDSDHGASTLAVFWTVAALRSPIGLQAANKFTRRTSPNSNFDRSTETRADYRIIINRTATDDIDLRP